MLNNTESVLVFGATGMTGRLLVSQLLSRGVQVTAVARSRDKMLSLLDNNDDAKLTVVEASVYDMPDSELTKLVGESTVAVSCLGHNLSFKGLYGKPRDLVVNTVKRVTTVMQKEEGETPKKFILMGSIGVYNPLATKNELTSRGWGERFALQVLRNLLPPHKDNERAAQYLANTVGPENNKVEWSVVRPDDLIDEPVSEYTLDITPQTGLFKPQTTSRNNVAHFMCELIQKQDLWENWRYKMPIPINKEQKKK